MMTPLGGISEQQREHFRNLQQCYATLNILLSYSKFVRMGKDEQINALERAKSYMALSSVQDGEKLQVRDNLALLKTKSAEFSGTVADTINAILDTWEGRHNANPQ